MKDTSTTLIVLVSFFTLLKKLLKSALMLFKSLAVSYYGNPLLSPLSFILGNGYINDYPTGRYLRDAKLYEIGAGTSEVRRLIIGRHFNEMFKNH